MNDNQRPLWRVGTKTLTAELKRRSESESVQRAFLSECELTLLLDEVVARGYSVQPPMVKMNGGEDGVPEERGADPWNTIEGLIGSVDAPPDWSLGTRWPVEGGDGE